MTSEVSLSLVELNISHLCTSLGGILEVLHGMTRSGSNEACSMLDTWWIFGIFLSGSGMLTVSKLLS